MRHPAGWSGGRGRARGRWSRDGRDRIELRGLRVLGVHGALPEEQDRAQPFEVDLDVEADLSVAGASDDLPDTVDYGAVAAVVAAVVGGERSGSWSGWPSGTRRRWRRSTPGSGAVTVTVRKLRPPVPVDLTSGGGEPATGVSPPLGGDGGPPFSASARTWGTGSGTLR